MAASEACATGTNTAGEVSAPCAPSVKLRTNPAFDRALTSATTPMISIGPSLPNAIVRPDSAERSEIRARECLVHDGHRSAARAIVFGERGSGARLDLEEPEVVGGHITPVHSTWLIDEPARGRCHREIEARLQSGCCSTRPAPRRRTAARIRVSPCSISWRRTAAFSTLVPCSDIRPMTMLSGAKPSSTLVRLHEGPDEQVQRLRAAPPQARLPQSSSCGEAWRYLGPPSCGSRARFQSSPRNSASAGARPKKSPATSVTVVVTRSTRQSRDTVALASSSRATSSEMEARSSCVEPEATSKPSSDPATASIVDSVST